MNHKQLLALFLCFVMILSSKIVSIENNKVVSVKDVSSNVDKYTIENIKEENDSYSINIFYPVTEYSDINNIINEKVESVKEAFLNDGYISDKKELTVSFEEFELKEYTSFKFNIKSNVGTVHNSEEVYTIVFKDGKEIKKDNLEIDNGLLKEKLREYLKNNDKIKEYSNESWIEKGLEKTENLDNFVLTENSIIFIFNSNTVAPKVAGVIQIELPLEILSLNLE